MPIASDASALTSVTASPLEPHDVDPIPIELKIPLPSSKSCSDQDLPAGTPTNRNPEDASDQEGPKEKSLPDVTESSSCNDVMVKPHEEARLGSSAVSLEELATLAEQEDYERRRTLSLEAEVTHLSLSNGLKTRLRDTFSIAYKNMIDQYKGDDQAGFTGLYEACERLMALNSIPGQEIPAVVETTTAEDAQVPDSTACRSLIHGLRPDDQDIINTFLSRIRTDLDYLANLISSLPSEELTALTASYHPAGIDLSVLPNHSHGRTQVYSRDSQMMKLSRRMDSIDRFHNQDPYFALLYGVFDSSSALDSLEQRRKIDVWSRTCAKIMTEGKPGSEEFAIATIDAFNEKSDWTLKPDMELFLLQVLAEGSFLLDPSTEPFPEKPGSVQPDGASHAIAVAEFFDRQIRRLFSLLSAGSPSAAIPQSVLNFIHGILHQIQDAQIQGLAKKFIVSRWYFATFLSSVIVYPEVQGLLLNHHIGQSARQFILNELVLRMQSHMFAVLSPTSSYMFIMPEMQDQIFRIIDFFEPPSLEKYPPKFSDIRSPSKVCTHQLMLSHWDIIGLIETLHPDALSGEIQSSSGVRAYPASTASSATLRPGHSDAGSLGAPSTDPSRADSPSTGDSIIGDGDLLEGKSKRRVFANPVPGGGDPWLDTPKADPTIASFSSQIKSICNKIRKLAKRGSDPNDSSQDWTFFDISVEDLALRMTENPLSSYPPSASQPAIDKDSRETELNSTKHRIVIETVLALLNPSANLLVRDRSEFFASSLAIEDSLQDLMENALATSRSQCDFSAAHQCWRALSIYKDIRRSEASQNFIHCLTRDIAAHFHTRLQDLTERRQKCDLLLRPLDLQRRNQQTALEELARLRKALRIKMWYVSDVKNSSAYEDALLVTKALRAMASPKRGKQPGSIAHWARQRLRGSTPYDRAEKQTLEALCAPKAHGGTSKLADEQIEITSRWMTRNSIENFCKGEERIQRFCHEVQKSVGKLAGMSLLESPVLWSSHLFRRERASFDTRSRQPAFSTSSHLPGTPPLRSNDSAPLRSPTIGQLPSTFLGLPGARAKAPLDFTGRLQITSLHQQAGQAPASQAPRPPYPALFSNQTFSHLSPPMTPLSPNISEVFSASVPTRAEPEHKLKRDFVEELRKKLMALMVSDLGYLLWTSGSETDAWTTRAAAQLQHDNRPEKSDHEGGESSAKVRVSNSGLTCCSPDYSGTESNGSKQSVTEIQNEIGKRLSDNNKESLDTFPYYNAYSTLLQKVSLTQDPYTKLQMLWQLEELVYKSWQERKLDEFRDGSASTNVQPETEPAVTLSKPIPRTKATSMEEVVANCTERRAGTIRRKQPREPLPWDFFSRGAIEQPVVGADGIVNKLLSLFRVPELRPSTLYRDLQFIAAFVPPTILDQTAQGRAFWDAGLAALALKEDLISATIHRANEITNYHLTTRQPSQFPDATNIPQYLPTTTLRDAAQLWLTAAKEGSPVAARELAIFYLTHPDLLRRTTAPFSKAKDVFTATSPVERSSVGALDPLTFSVVLHWMDIASVGGDNEAIEFLRANGALRRAS